MALFCRLASGAALLAGLAIVWAVQQSLPLFIPFPWWWTLTHPNCFDSSQTF